ncbi:MAG: sigma 54-interacting transcriptional regulator [Anaerotruncus sp.]|nr:sigma 54-interacting transcriptional regulator [Anaerotruncus sp.]
MTRILLVVPYLGVKELFEQRISQVDDPEIRFEITHIYGTPPEALIQNCPYDIIIARGMTYRALHRMLPDKYLIEIAMTGFDVADAIAYARRQFSPQRIAILTHDPTLNNVHQIQELCGIPIETYDVEDEQEILDALRQAIQNGTDVFIGGLTLCQQCDVMELHRVHIKSGVRSIERAVQEALSVARSINQERAKTKLMQSLLNGSRDAVLSIDREGRVTALNNAALVHFKLSLTQQAVGSNITSFYEDETDWRNCLATGMEQESLHTFHDKVHLVNCKPILVDGQSAGVLITIQNAEKISETETKIRKRLAAKGFAAKYYFSNIIGKSERMRSSIVTAYKYSQVDSNVLLIGETGTGKELFAQSIHNASRRCNEPFVAVNCAALPENLLESELFGYVEGAFSGATKGGKPGLFELAHCGTIFLDEIGEMPINLQAKLLRVLQEREIRRLGDDRVVPVNVRVISATNVNIEQKIAAGQFRADLYYRLNLLNIQLPPLRERPEDIPEMISYFVSRFACDYERLVPRLTNEATQLLCSYSWRGNSRELRNLCERLVVLNESGEIGRREVEELNLAIEPAPPKAVPAPAAAASYPSEELIQQLLQERVKREDLAKMLGISRTTLWRRMHTKRS